MSVYLKRYINGEKDNVIKEEVNNGILSTCYDRQVNYKTYEPTINWINEYFQFEILTNGTFKHIKASNSNYDNTDNYLQYMINDGNWTELPNDTNVSVSAGDVIKFKGNLGSAGESGIGSFYSTCNFNVMGNILSLQYLDDFQNKTTTLGTGGFGYLFANNNSHPVETKNLIMNILSSKPQLFKSMFYNCTSLVSTPEIRVTTSNNGELCRYMFTGCTSLTYVSNISLQTINATNCTYMFKNCTSLSYVPDLKLTTLSGGNGLQEMFRGCTNLVYTPKMTINTMSTYSTYAMFYGCTNLVDASNLTIKGVGSHSCACMFYGCTSLKKAPILSATSMTTYCFRSMFYNCTSLQVAPDLPATTLGNNCYNNMFRECKALIIPPKLPATTLTTGCYLTMFAGCTSLKIPPILPAKGTLTANCYRSMFLDCTSLMVAPKLPATTIGNNGYFQMFKGCTSLKYIEALFTSWPTPDGTTTSGDTGLWVSGVPTGGVFIRNKNAEWIQDTSYMIGGSNKIPSGWTVYDV